MKTIFFLLAIIITTVLHAQNDSAQVSDTTQDGLRLSMRFSANGDTVHIFGSGIGLIIVQKNKYGVFSYIYPEKDSMINKIDTAFIKSKIIK